VFSYLLKPAADSQGGDMIFISLMGTQALAVLNPLLALVEQGQKPDKVYILPTKLTRDRADILKHYLVQEIFSEQDIRIVPVSNTLESSEYGPAAQHAVCDILSEDSKDITFNIAGGMNFQIAACVQSLSPRRCLFVYPEFDKVSAIIVEHEEIVSSDSLPLPKPVDVFALQGIRVEKLETKSSDHRFLEKFLQQNRISLPGDALKNVAVRNDQSGRRVDFDLVWNSGNHLHFLKSFKAKNEAKTKEDHLKDIRAIITVATNRELFSELYDRKIGVLTDHTLFDERIQKEGGNKVRSFFLNHSSFTGFLTLELNRFMNPVQVPEKNMSDIEIDSFDTGKNKPGNDVLILSLGTDIDPSLIALWSHQPKHACFVYTAGNDVVEDFKTNMKTHKKILPVETVSFYPVSVSGAEILDIEIPGEHTALVNITPGTKGHTTFLALWAVKNGGRIFSLNNAAKTFQQIPEGDSGVQRKPGILDYLKIKGFRVQNHGGAKKGLKKHWGQYERILEFLRMMDRERVPVSNFYQKPVILKKSGAKSVCNFKKEKVTISQPGKSNMTFSVRQNEWFESLTAYVVLQCGAKDVRIRFRSAWSEPVEEHLIKKYKNGKDYTPPFMSDVDVIATLDNTYYVISCKATKEHNADEFTAEANAFASLFGRFAVPMLCYLKYDGQPYNSSNGVYIFGYKTLCDTQQMKALLAKALADRSRTS
jgi:hypothetical protein